MLKRIRDLREDTDLTQEYVAKTVLNCTRSAYSKMESGSRLISIDDLVKLADFYKVSLDYLVGRVDNKEGYYFKK
ncbi:helix-turn-helix domain-containing protein [Streptococcus oralis]|uniref:helix-turn-helix domain-containing protein n=1 Tax=Streptococcus oralis TaxID=1303 RepID=UPI00066CF565|nr:helix-turn-helix transcriptional regulator [Streptococcus oralis]